MRIDAEGIHYRELNERINQAVARGERHIILDRVLGQRYIGAGQDEDVRITINGVPGNDLAAFMNGAEIIVNGNVQDGVANTMNAGRVVVHGDAGDILGHSMRGGMVMVRGRVGYRCGIHCKAYGSRRPILVVGHTAGDYLGEYMAGGIIVVLNANDEDGSPVECYCGTGMHGGTMFIRGVIEDYQLGAEVGVDKISAAEWNLLKNIIAQWCVQFDLEPERFVREDFVRIYPRTARPYGKLYAC